MSTLHAISTYANQARVQTVTLSAQNVTLSAQNVTLSVQNFIRQIIGN